MLSNHNSYTQTAAAVQSSARGTCPPQVSLISLDKLASPTAILVVVEEEQDDHQNASRGRRQGGAATGGRPARARPLWATFPACFGRQTSSSCAAAHTPQKTKDAKMWSWRLQPASAAPLTRAQRKACYERRARRRQIRPRSSPEVSRRRRCPGSSGGRNSSVLPRPQNKSAHFKAARLRGRRVLEAPRSAGREGGLPGACVGGVHGTEA